ncbi:hypothetical protein BDR07DRAFT_1490635 [Suillus spraguei]|nr:hypothetical protein BDR07DRAFT_1490635 [Suillus spraguei]
MSSSEQVMRQLAVQICKIVTVARTMLTNDTFFLAIQAGRVVTESMKLAPDVAAIPPILLSCAMELRTCAKQVADSPKFEIVRVPDWGAIGHNDHRLMGHPHHKKAMMWISSTGTAEDVESVKVFDQGINRQAILPGAIGQREVMGRYEVGAGASTSHQSSTEEPVVLQETFQMAKPRVFGPAKRKAADRKGKGVEQNHADVEPHKDEDQPVVMENTQQRLYDKRDRKRSRRSHMFVEDAESSDHDLRMDVFMEGPSNKVIAREGNINDTCNEVTEIIHNDHCTPCRAGNLKCIFGYSNQTGKKLGSCEECTRKKQTCFNGKDSDAVNTGEGCVRSRTQPRVRSKIRTRSPTASASSKIHLGISMGDPHVVTPDIKLSSGPPMPTLVIAAINSMEGRLIRLEEGFTKLNTAMEKLEGEQEALRQRAVPQDPTLLLPHGPSPPPIQTPMSELSTGEPQPVISAIILPATLPPITLPSAASHSCGMATSTQPCGTLDNVTDFGNGHTLSETH